MDEWELNSENVNEEKHESRKGKYLQEIKWIKIDKFEI